MPESARITVAVLAAGQSQRFGEADKLCASFRDKPLGVHVTDTLAGVGIQTHFHHRIVIASRSDHPCADRWSKAGFATVLNPNADEGMGTSVAIASRIARRAGSDVLLIALADMPLVPAAHFSDCVMKARVRGAEAVIASSDGRHRMPPAAFGCDHFDRLAELDGDVGARIVLHGGEALDCPPEWLVDIDTQEALAALHKLK